MKTSATGIALIKRFEGCRLKAYLDTVAKPPVWTIGYGETGPYVYEGLVYRQDQAEMGLKRRLTNEFEPGVMMAIGNVPTTQNQFDAMVSLTWNIGVKAFAGSSVARLHRAGPTYHAAAAKCFALWDEAGGEVNTGLVRRRAAESHLYLSGLGTVRIDPARAMQEALQAAGFYKGAIDGKWGPASRAAYDQFNQGIG